MKEQWKQNLEVNMILNGPSGFIRYPAHINQECYPTKFDVSDLLETLKHKSEVSLTQDPLKLLLTKFHHEY